MIQFDRLSFCLHRAMAFINTKTSVLRNMKSYQNIYNIVKQGKIREFSQTSCSKENLYFQYKWSMHMKTPTQLELSLLCF